MAAAPLRILVVDGDSRGSVGACFFRAFRALGQDAHFLDNAAWLGGMNPSIVARAARRAIRPLAVPSYNAFVLSRLAFLRPDILFVPKGVWLRSRTIAAARRFARTCVVFQNDDFMNAKSNTSDMRKALPLWDVVFTPRRFSLDELSSLGARRVEHLPFAYDPSLSYPPREDELDRSLGSSAVFVGTCMPERIGPLEALARRVPLAVFGNQWQRVPSGSPLRAALHPPVFGRRLRTVNASAGVNVAFVAKTNRDEHTMRTFEIPACGGFMLAARTHDHLTFLREDEEAAFFGSVDELVEKTVKYLGDPAARRRIATAGRERVTGRERYEDRAAVVLEIVKDVLARPGGARKVRSA